MQFNEIINESNMLQNQFVNHIRKCHMVPLIYLFSIIDLQNLPFKITASRLSSNNKMDTIIQSSNIVIIVNVSRDGFGAQIINYLSNYVFKKRIL